MSRLKLRERPDLHGARRFRLSRDSSDPTLRGRATGRNLVAMDRPDLATANERRWTCIDTYIQALARRETARRRRQLAARTEPEFPRLMLSTFPFLATMLVLALLIVLFAVAAWPPSQPEFRPKPQHSELGTAPRGWMEEARKEFR